MPANIDGRIQLLISQALGDRHRASYLATETAAKVMFWLTCVYYFVTL